MIIELSSLLIELENETQGRIDKENDCFVTWACRIDVFVKSIKIIHEYFIQANLLISDIIILPIFKLLFIFKIYVCLALQM